MSLFFPDKPDWSQDYVFDYWEKESHLAIPWDFSKILPSGGTAKFPKNILFQVANGGYLFLSLSDYRRVIDLQHNQTYGNSASLWVPLKDWDITSEILYLYYSGSVASLGWLRLNGGTYTDKARRLANPSLSVVEGEDDWVGNSALCKDRYEEPSATAILRSKIDFGSVLTIVRLAILYESVIIYGTTGFSLEYSGDDVAWTVIKSGTSLVKEVVNVDNISARYVRLTLAGDGTNASIFHLFKLWAWV